MKNPPQRLSICKESSNVKPLQCTTQEELVDSTGHSNCQTRILATNDSVFDSPPKSPVISDRFTQPAKMTGTNTSYEFPSPMHAVLIQYDKPLTETTLACDDHIRSPDLRKACLNKSMKNEEIDEEKSTTRFIQKLVRRSNSFKKLKDLQELKEMKRSRFHNDKERFTENTNCHAIRSADNDNLKQNNALSSSSAKSNTGNTEKKNVIAKCNSSNSVPITQRGRPIGQSQVQQKKVSISARSFSSSRLSMTSSDGGYFSNPNSPQGSLKFGGSSRRSVQSDTSHISDRLSLFASPNNKKWTPEIDTEIKTEAMKPNKMYDVKKTQTRAWQCQRSHSFSGSSNLPLSFFQQRPRSHSTAGPMEPVAQTQRKRNSFSGAISTPRYAQEPKLTLSFTAFMNDVQDTFI